MTLRNGRCNDKDGYKRLVYAHFSLGRYKYSACTLQYKSEVYLANHGVSIFPYLQPVIVCCLRTTLNEAVRTKTSEGRMDKLTCREWSPTCES